MTLAVFKINVHISLHFFCRVYFEKENQLSIKLPYISWCASSFMGVLRGWQGTDHPTPTGKSQVVIGVLRNTATETHREETIASRGRFVRP